MPMACRMPTNTSRIFHQLGVAVSHKAIPIKRSGIGAQRATSHRLATLRDEDMLASILIRSLGKHSLGEGPGLSGPTWWRIWVSGAELDRRIFLQAFRDLIANLVTGATTHELVQGTPSRSSFKSVRRLMTFGSGRVNGGSYMFTCQIKCTFQFRHLTADNRSAT